MAIRWVRTGVLAVAGFALMACDSAQPAPSERSEAEHRAPTQPEKAELEKPPQKPVKQVVAPFTVSLQAPVQAKAGKVELTAVIDSPKGFVGDIDVKVELPEGAKLLEGEATENLKELPAGKTTRSFELLLGTAPTEQAPVKVIVEGQDAAKTFGARAERKYPSGA